MFSDMINPRQNLVQLSNYQVPRTQRTLILGHKPQKVLEYTLQPCIVQLDSNGKISLGPSGSWHSWNTFIRRNGTSERFHGTNKRLNFKLAATCCTETSTSTGRWSRSSRQSFHPKTDSRGTSSWEEESLFWRNSRYTTTFTYVL